MEHLDGGLDVVEWNGLSTIHASPQRAVEPDATKQAVRYIWAGAELAASSRWKHGWAGIVVVQGWKVLSFVAPRKANFGGV